MKIFKLNKYILLLVFLVLLDCCIGTFVGIWRDWYWSAISDKHFGLWMKYIAEFIVAALLSCGVSGYSSYLISVISLTWRTKLTRKALKLDYRRVEGHQQRIQEDCGRYPSLLLSLSVGLLRSLIMIVAFSFIILQHVSWYYLLIPFGYAMIGTLVAGKIAFPLINLNYMNQVVEARFRQSLSRLNYLLAHNNNHKLFIKTKHLNYFQSFFSQITVIFPHLCLASLYFSGKIVFGVFMQVAAAMAEITSSLSVILLSFSDINNLISCHRRLRELRIV